MLLEEELVRRANAAPRVGQARLHSLIEAIGGTAVGFILSWLVLMFIVRPLFDLRTNAGEDFIITCIFTVTSVLRSYFIRRFFNWLHLRRTHQ